MVVMQERSPQATSVGAVSSDLVEGVGILHDHLKTLVGEHKFS